MAVLIGVWFGLVGGLAALAGLSSMHRARQLRRRGLTAWATAMPSRETVHEQPVTADGRLVTAAEQAGGSPSRTLLQYALADGRVMERSCPNPVRKRAWLRPGQQVLVWYDPADPLDVLVYGRDGRLSNWAFIAVGVLFILLGTTIALLGH